MLKEFQVKMENQYLQKWRYTLSKSRKLQFFASFKDSYEIENYLNVISNFDQRRQFTKLRISNHKLAIEEGRYSKTPQNERYCNLCSQEVTESEQHFIFHCPLY